MRLARELVAACRSLNRTIAELDQELEQRTEQIAPALLELPGSAAVTAAKLLAEIAPIDRFKTDAQLARHSGVAHAGSELRPRPAPQARAPRQPPTQPNAAFGRIAIAQGRCRAAPRLRLAQTSGTQAPRRSYPLPQTPPRTRRLQTVEANLKP